MIRIVLFWIVMLPLSLLSQKAIGTWTIHAGYYYPLDIVETETDIVTNGNIGLFFLDKNTKEKTVLDKTGGLSEVGIVKIGYNSVLKKMVVVYENSNIDIIDYNKGKEIFNMPDIKQKVIIGDKRIYNISFKDNFCYLAAGFGIVVIDLKNYVVKETYKIGLNGENMRVNNLVFFDNQIVAATEKGLRSAPLTAPNLQDFSAWSGVYNHNLGIQNITAVQTYQNQLFCLKQDTLFQRFNNNWSPYFGDTNYTIRNLLFYDGQLTANLILDSNKTKEYGFTFLSIKSDFSKEFIFTDKVSYPTTVIKSVNGHAYIGGVGGLHEVNGSNSILYNIQGPSTDFYQFSYSNKILFASTGSINPEYKNTGYYYFDGYTWTNQSYTDSRFTGLFDNMGAAYVNNKVYLANNIGGLAELDNQTVTIYNEKNSPLEFYSGDQSVRVIDVKEDVNGNVWMLNYFCANPLKMLSKDKTWYKFNPLNENKAQYKLHIDKNNNKWIVFRNDGMMVFNEGKDLLNASDDKAVRLDVMKDKCEVSNRIYDIAEDKEGSIWCATDKGVQVFNCGSNPLNGNCKSYAPILKKGDGSVDANDTFIECLLSYEIVNTIAVDGGNRKWCGTNNGVFLISADGKTQLEHFTTENSPLPSNVILDLFVHPTSGDVFMGTGKAIVSYTGKSTEGLTTQSEPMRVFPNPIRRDYEGLITIDNLVSNATVKITDISGRLMYESKAEGGRMVWNGKMYNGERPHSGVYMVFTIDETGEETGIGKIVFQQ